MDLDLPRGGPGADLPPQTPDVPDAPIPSRDGADPCLNFLAIGDWGRAGDPFQRKVAARMGETAAKIASRFVVSLGDNLYENGVTSVDDPLWADAFESVYTAPALQTPWYALLGNHDYNGEPQAQLDYARTSDRWRMPARYYTVSGAQFDAPWVDLFLLDTSPMVRAYHEGLDRPLKTNIANQDVPAQLAWLEGELGRSRATWKIVCGHHTLYSGGSAHGNNDELIARLVPILRRHGVAAYLCGHEHDLQHIRRDGIDFICSGAGSEVRPTSLIRGSRFALARSGFAAFAVRRRSLGFSFHDEAGATVYSAALETVA